MIKKRPVGEKFSDEVRVFHIKVVRSFLKAGVPLAKIDCFREMLEESAFRLSHSTTRWWSMWEVMRDMLVAFDDVLPFLENSDLPLASKS